MIARLATLIGIPPWLVLSGILALSVIGFGVWLHFHDQGVRADYLVELKEQARVESDKAATKADAQSEIRKAETDEVQNRIANSAGVDDLFDSLRAKSGTK